MSDVFDLAAMKAKIAKLLAKAEGTDNPTERETYTDKATELMIRLGIDAAELEAAGEVKPEDIVEVHRNFRGNYSIVMIPFCHSVLRGFGNLQMLQSVRSPMLRVAYIIGHKTDVELFNQLMDSLEAQAMSALRAWQKENREMRRYQTDMEKYVDSRSFLEAFGSTVGRRLRESRRTTTAESQMSSGAELVLASKEARVNEWMSEAHPKVRKARGGVREHGYEGLWAGRAAGERADIGNTRIGSRQALR